LFYAFVRIRRARRGIQGRDRTAQDDLIHGTASSHECVSLSPDHAHSHTYHAIRTAIPIPYWRSTAQPVIGELNYGALASALDVIHLSAAALACTVELDVVHCHTVLSGALQRGEQPATHWRKCPKHCGRQLKQGHGCASDNTPGDPSDRYGKCGGNQAGCEREREGGAQGAQEEADCPDPGQA
jgi:hypothetical protein